jgi:DNA modification methylase
MPAQSQQLNLFGPIMQLYRDGAPVSNDTLYEGLRKAKAIDAEDVRAPVGKAGQIYSITKRRLRWYQQTLKALGLIERVPAARGVWRVTPKGKNELTPAPAQVRMIGFSTELGVGLWADATDVFGRIAEPIHLLLTSPPYPLAQARAYGGPKQAEYVDFVCRLLEPVVANLVPGGSICLNVSNDIFIPGSPARSLYREHLILALHSRLGLFKLDQIIWEDRSKAPGPIAWASKERFHLNTAWEPCYWLTNDPSRLRSDNRRVLQPHSERQQRLIARGGEQRSTNYGDGANRLAPGAFGRQTAGAIPKNVLQFGHRCHSQNAMRKAAVAAGLPIHGATMPLSLARFLVEFLTEKGDLVVDTCAGWFTTAAAAEESGRRWIATERMLEYVLGASSRFESASGFRRHLSLAGTAA